MFGLAIGIAGLSLLAFLIVLFVGVRFFGALVGETTGNGSMSDDDTSSQMPQFKRFDVPSRGRR